MTDDEIDQVVAYLKAESVRTGRAPLIPITRENVKSLYLGIFNVLDHINYEGPDAEEIQEAAFDLTKDGVTGTTLGVSGETVADVSWIVDDPASGNRIVVSNKDLEQNEEK